MWDRKNGKTEETRLELCDLRGAAFAESEAVRGYVPDSSSVNSDNDWIDGLRLITACSEARFALMQDNCRHRLFTYEELWAAKTNRALTTGPPVLSIEQLGCRTGLRTGDRTRHRLARRTPRASG